MKFNLKYGEIDEIRNLPSDDYSIKDLMDDLELSSQTIVCKQNGELVIEESKIKENDDIQLIQVIYGG